MKEYRYCPFCAGPLQVEQRDGFERRVCVAEGCDFVFWNNPMPVVAAIVEDADEVILVRNLGWPETWYGLVTGFLEHAEHPDQAVLREVEEELGLQAELVSMVGMYNFERMNQLIIAYHVRASGEVRINEAELAGYKRVKTSKLRPWSFGTGDAVRDWLAGRQDCTEGKGFIRE